MKRIFAHLLGTVFRCIVVSLIVTGFYSCQQEPIQSPAPVQPQNNIVEIIIKGQADSAYVNGNIDGGFYYVTDSTYEDYFFNINPGNQSYTIYAQYIAQPGDSISIEVLINGSQATISTGVGFTSCLFVY